MARLLLLTVVAGIFLAMFSAAPHQPLSAETGGMQPVAPKPLQMEAPPVVCGPAPTQYQIAQILLNTTTHIGVATAAHNAQVPLRKNPSRRDSAQASTILRI